MSATNRSENDLQGVTLLGDQNTKYQFEYCPEILEKFLNKNLTDAVVSLDCFEFASRCPKTGQPDFATIYISYIPGNYMVESKSLKLYLFSFQQHGSFHEDCVCTIMNDLVNLLKPKYLEVYGDFNSRGGISILPFYNYAEDSYKDFKSARMLDMMSKHTHHRPRTS